MPDLIKMENTEEHILVEAEKLFMKFGMRSVTMDDIAKHLGMSKKTIYANFKDKNNLVKSLISRVLKNDECTIQQCMKHSENAIEEIFSMTDFFKDMLSSINPIVFYDLEKYHNEAYQMMMEFHQNRIYHSVKANLERGINEHIFRPEINSEILAQARVGQINWIFELELIKSGKYSMYEVMRELTMQFLHGICTLSGHVLINNYTNQNNQTIK